MALVVAALTTAINDALGVTGPTGLPISVTSCMTVYACAVITSLKAATFSHALITACTTFAQPIKQGAGKAGIIAGVVSATWAGIISSGFPGATLTSAESDASTAYIMASGIIRFPAGTVNGVSGATSCAPGPLNAGVAQGGVIEGLTGAAWASALKAVFPTSDVTLMTKMYQAIVDYLKLNGICKYATGSVTGTCPPSSGPMTGGIGVGGIIT